MTKTNTQLTMVSRSQKEKVNLMHLDDFRASLYGETLVLCGVLDCLLAATFLSGGFTPCQFEHHVRPKFATPILHVIDNF